MIILFSVLIYFGLLLAFSRLTTRGSSNDTFFRANRRSPWYMVAFGMAVSYTHLTLPTILLV